MGEAEIQVHHRDAVPGQTEAEAGVYFLPHEVRLSIEPGGPGTIAAIVKHVNSAGAVVRLDLQRHYTEGLED